MNGSILFITTGDVSDCRFVLAERAAKEAGYSTEMLSNVPYYKGSHFDLFVSSRPGPEALKFLNEVVKSGRPVIVDMDDDFLSIPKTNPAYNIIGEGREGYHKALLTFIREKASRMVYPGEELEKRYGRRGTMIPNGWDESNPIWYQPRVGHLPGTVTVSWFGTNTHRQDFQLVKPDLMRLLKERDNLNVCIGADPEIYNLFREIPHKQKLFLPGMEYKDYPIMYQFTDIALAPLRDTYFNRAKSDIKLVEAGARAIPYVASPVAQYKAWSYLEDETSGIIAGDSGLSWYEALTELIDHPDLRSKMGGVGSKVADKRTFEVLGAKWKDLFEEVLG